MLVGGSFFLFRIFLRSSLGLDSEKFVDIDHAAFFRVGFDKPVRLAFDLQRLTIVDAASFLRGHAASERRHRQTRGYPKSKSFHVFPVHVVLHRRSKTDARRRLNAFPILFSSMSVEPRRFRLVLGAMLGVRR
ncbi:hypothetical protein [Rhodomicrobium sp.]|uniref:hypothetical protein n=1 Tax=Rhodomicrobium sp. TaxID=2720632 RepID=UPI0039E410F3